jgi:eukaryotic-like serine/threonine-protein kinase
MRYARAIAPALESFESERSNLAQLHHPNIAQLYDGGDLADGRAYIVMELVPGIGIADYVQQHKLTADAVLRLFHAVCNAVQSAHRGLIVHADLKPSNILVTQEAVAKLLDFGVSRLIASGADSGQQPSGSASTALTAAYSSPERKRGEPPSISDDVYSLGVILAELLSGQRLTDTVSADAHCLPRDLRAIVAKATAELGTDRYNSVSELTADLDRYKRHQPVSARAPTNRYLTQCFVRRHRLGAIAAGVVGTSVIAALLLTTTLYAKAEVARVNAEYRYTQVRQLSSYMLGDLQMQLSSMPQSLSVRKEIVGRGEGYLRSLSMDDTAPLAVQLDAIAGLTQLAEMQGVPGKPNVGDTDSARLNLQRAWQIAERLQAAQLSPLLLALAAARIQIDSAAILAARDNNTAGASQQLALARRQLNTAAALDADNAILSALDLEWTLHSADVANWASDYTTGASMARLAIDKWEATPVTAYNARERAIGLARGWDSLAEAVYYRGDFDDALEPYQREIAITEAAIRQFPGDSLIERNRLRAYWSLGSTYLQLDRNSLALTPLATATAIGRELSRQEPDDADVLRNAAIAYSAYGQALAGVGQYAAAIEILSATVQQRQQLAREHSESAANLRDYSISLAALADVYARSGDLRQACAMYPQARAVHEQLQREGRSVALSENYSLKRLDESARRYCGEAR